MEMLTGKLVGKLGAGRWAQIYDFEPDNPEKIVSRGRLVAAVSFETNEELTQIQTVEVGREILSRIGELYFGNQEDSQMESLRITVQKIREEFEQVEFLGAVLAGDYLYIGANSGAVWIKTPDRQGFLAQKITGVKMFSSKVKDGLLMVLGNSGLWQKVDEKQICDAAVKRDDVLEAVTETINAGLHTGDEGGAEAGIVAVFKKTEVVQEQIVIPSKITELKQKWLSGIEQRIYLRHGDRQQQRKQMLYMGLGLLVLLLVLTGLGQWRKQINEKANSQIGKQIEQLEYDFQQAKATVQIDPLRSQQLIKGIILELSKIPQEEKKDARLIRIADEINQVENEAFGRMEIKLTELVDLKLIRDDFKGEKMVWGSGKLIVLDNQIGRIAEIDVKTGSGKITGGGEELKEAKLLAIYPGKVLAATKKGVYEIKENENLLKINEEWDLLRIKNMNIWAGNIYILESDSETGVIWRYQISGAGYGAKQTWNKEGINSELAKMADMAIDGNIWIIGDAGGKQPVVYKYTRGVKDDLVLSGFDDGWQGGQVRIYTNDESKNIYIWEGAGKRVIVFDKNGGYVKQWKNDSLGNQMRDFVVDEINKQIFLTDGVKIYKGEF